MLNIATPVKTTTFDVVTGRIQMGKIAAVTRQPELMKVLTCINSTGNACFLFDYNQAKATATLRVMKLTGVEATDVASMANISVAMVPQSLYAVIVAKTKVYVDVVDNVTSPDSNV